MNLPTTYPKTKATAESSQNHDQELLIALQNANDHRFLKLLWAKYYLPLVTYASKRGQAFHADDIVSEAFTRFWQSRHNFDHLYCIRCFLYKTVRNSCIDHVRSSRIHERIHGEIFYVNNIVEETDEEDYNTRYKEYIQQLKNHTRILPPRCQKIFRLHLFGNLSTRQIAGRMKITEQTVRNQKAKAIRMLGECFKKKQFN